MPSIRVEPGRKFVPADLDAPFRPQNRQEPTPDLVDQFIERAGPAGLVIRTHHSPKTPDTTEVFQGFDGSLLDKLERDQAQQTLYTGFNFVCCV